MAAINEFSDILSAMEQNPELQEAMRNHVLGQELRQLPAVVHRQGEQLAEALQRLGELAATIQNVAEQISSYALASSRTITAIVERQDRFEADIAELKAAQVRLEASVQEMRESLARMEARQDRMEHDVADLKSDMVEVKGDVAELKSDMVEVKADVADLKSDMVEVKGAQDRMQATQDTFQTSLDGMRAKQEKFQVSLDRFEATQNRMQGQLNNLTGTDYERKVVKRAPRAARRYLGLRSVGVVYGIDVSGSIDLQALLEQATESRAITDEQADEVERADLILRGERTGNEAVFAVAEVSITIDDSDIDRARNRANILANASGLPALSVVIGTSISDANRERANYSGVTVIIMGE